MLTTSYLASLFTEENRRSREQAVGTSEFLESQLQATKAKLESQEEKIKQYKLQFLGELPEEMENNLRALTRLREDLRLNSDNIRVVEGRKVFLEARRRTLENTLNQVVGYQDNLVSEDPGRLLLIKRAQIAELASKYTDNHPSLINLRKEVEYLEKRFRDTSRESLEPAGGPGEKSVVSSSPDISLFKREREERSSPDFFLPNREKDDLRTVNAQLASTKAELSTLKQENERIRGEIASLQRKLDRSPRREMELFALTRDYDNLKNTYENLHKKLLEANISQDLLERQKGEQFKVLDPANLPMKPFKPKKRMVFVIAFLIAAGFSFGGAFGLESVDETLRGPKDFQNLFKLRVLACIPDVEDDTLARQRALRLGAIVSGCLVFFAGILVFIWFFEEKIRAILKI
jgi:succinoglycan biosynthesis transport protein ExoP